MFNLLSLWSLGRRPEISANAGAAKPVGAGVDVGLGGGACLRPGQGDPLWSPWRSLLGLMFSTGISLLAYRRRSLSRSGVLGAVVTGTTICGLGGWSWGLALVFFFASSSAFSHFRERDKAYTAADKFNKGSQRDLGQVVANGGAAVLLALGYGLTRTPALRDMLQAGYVGVLATATADTWATEVGVLSPRLPRLITSGKRVAPGTSGGVTLLGTATATLGALLLGTVFWVLQRCRVSPLPLIALVSGLAGSLFDSLLGATLQAMYYCPACNKETERHIHTCGTKTRPLRGLSWLNNDGVNFIATLCGGLVAMGMQRTFTNFHIRNTPRGLKALRKLR